MCLSVCPGEALISPLWFQAHSLAVHPLVTWSGDSSCFVLFQNGAATRLPISVLLPRLAAEWDAAFLAPLSSLPPNSSKQTFCILRLFWWETDGDNKVMKTCESSKKKKFPSFANHSVILNTSWHGNGKCLQFSTLFSFSTSHFACNHPISHTHTHF